MVAIKQLKFVEVGCLLAAGFIGSILLTVGAQEAPGGSAGGGSDPNASGPHADCLTNSGSCFVAHDGPGCSDPYCCGEVCSHHGPEGAFCCDVTWDQVCVSLAETYCKGPIGACCDWVNTDENGEAVCRDVPLNECPARPGSNPPQWIEGVSCASEPFDPPCGNAACCHYQSNPSTGNLEEVCNNLTKGACATASPADRESYWQPGLKCGMGSQRCPRLACVNRTGSCQEAHQTPGCCDEWCCSIVCSYGSVGAFCCNTYWDQSCVSLTDEGHCYRVPVNDVCAPYPEDDCHESGAMLIEVPGSASADNFAATTSPDEPGFCCNNGVGECIGAPDAGTPCIEDFDCISGKCSERIPNPGGQALGTMWFKFVQGPGTTAGIHTCNSISPALDSIVQVFRASDNSSPLAECNSLIPIACNDDFANCAATQRNSRLCLRNLTPGATYYIMLAAKTPNRQGMYTVTISTSCSGTTQPCTNCPVGDVEFVDPPSGVVDARRPFPPNSTQVEEGIRTIVATGPSGATADCWSICESPAAPASIQITKVDEAPPGTYTVHLNRPIAPGAVTMVTYTDNDGQKTVGRFIAHPANVNGDSRANTYDILSLIDFLNGVGPLPWGRYSGDLDHSGMIGPADILTLIDLFNGANEYAVWYGTALPEASGCP